MADDDHQGKAARKKTLKSSFNRAAPYLYPQKNFLKRMARAVVIGLLPIIPVFYAEDIREAFNEAANYDKEPHEMVLNTEEVDGQYAAVISVPYILETGRVPAYAPFSGAELLIGNYYIDWDSDDSYLNAIDNVTADVIERAQRSPTLQRLLEKESWTDTDQQQWDALVLSYVQAINVVPGLDRYRTQGDENENQLLRPLRLNELSEDMDNGTYNIEFDCEAMTLTELVIMQKVANELLSDEQRPLYFYSTGEIEQGDNDIGRHAFGLSVSPRTQKVLGIVEGTASFLSYAQPHEEILFEDYVEGEPAMYGFGSIYGMGLTQDDIDRLRGRKKPSPE